MKKFFMIAVMAAFLSAGNMVSAQVPVKAAAKSETKAVVSKQEVKAVAVEKECCKKDAKAEAKNECCKKDAKAEAKKECCKKDAKAEAKKECCKKDAKAEAKKECCKKDTKVAKSDSKVQEAKVSKKVEVKK